MSSVNEFHINLKLLNDILIKMKPLYNNHTKESLLNKKIFDTIIKLQALAIYVEKNSINQLSIDNEFDNEVRKILKINSYLLI